MGPIEVTELMTLSADALTCRRGGRLIFDQLSFSVASGRALLVTGRNGVGKSSLLRMIAGLLRIAGGRLSLSGGDPEQTIGEQAHYLGHLDALKPALSVAENLSFWTSYLGGSGDQKEALASVGLEALAHLPASYLSAGQRRRLSIARLIAVKRPLWLLDEPTAALDTDAQAMLLTLLQSHLADGGMVVAATHLPLGLADAAQLRLDAA